MIYLNTKLMVMVPRQNQILKNDSPTINSNVFFLLFFLAKQLIIAFKLEEKSQFIQQISGRCTDVLYFRLRPLKFIGPPSNLISF